MANRHARRLREQQAAERLARERQAFQRSKSAQKRLRQASVLRAALSPETGNLFGALLRRKAVLRCLNHSPGFFLVLQQFFESGEPLRLLDSWRAPRSAEAGRMFRSLARHAMLRYAMPEPLLRSIADMLALGDHPDARALNWFVLIARGGNLSRAEGLPFDFTKKAAHFFLQAPHDMPLPAAMRWAQLRAMMMPERLAGPLAVLLAQETPEQEAVWMELFRFILRFEAQVEVAELDRIVDFVRYQRLDIYQLIVSRRYQIPVEPLYPGFQIGQATPASLRMRMEQWDNHLKTMARTARWRKFPVSPVAERFETEVKGVSFCFVRICNIEELLREGIAMHHCSGTYGWDCSAGEVTLWSLRKLNPAGEEVRVATVELTNDLRIVQVKAKANQKPAEDAFLAVRQWARWNGLRFESW